MVIVVNIVKIRIIIPLGWIWIGWECRKDDVRPYWICESSLIQMHVTVVRDRLCIILWHVVMPPIARGHTWLYQPLPVSTVPNSGRNLSKRGHDEDEDHTVIFIVIIIIVIITKLQTMQVKTMNAYCGMGYTIGRTLNRGYYPGSNHRRFLFAALAVSFSPHCPVFLNCINEYLASNSCGKM